MHVPIVQTLNFYLLKKRAPMCIDFLIFSFIFPIIFQLHHQKLIQFALVEETNEKNSKQKVNLPKCSFFSFRTSYYLEELFKSINYHVSLMTNDVLINNVSIIISRGGRNNLLQGNYKNVTLSANPSNLSTVFFFFLI